jgi:hypothetical protein
MYSREVNPVLKFLEYPHWEPNECNWLLIFVLRWYKVGFLYENDMLNTLRVTCKPFITCGPDNVVGIASGYGLDGSGIEYR